MPDASGRVRSRKGQRQDSLADQMRDVLIRATEMGCYDAHEWIARRFYDVSAPARTQAGARAGQEADQ